MKKSISIYLIVVIVLLFGGYIFIALNQQPTEVKQDPQVVEALNFLSEEYDNSDSVVKEYVDFHQSAIPDYVYEELLATETPTPNQILSLVVHVKTKENLMYFSLKDDITDYLLIVTLDEDKNPIKVEMQQDND